ncbi:MAG TPA: nucleoside hydrolase [Thermomicrobiaceae bacterium]|nr:nucleoside hydrolase [Thermomicrobiaceae bacterium]
MSQEPTAVLLDVDTGIDDAIAIALALRSPRLQVVGITTVAGNVTVDRTTDNTLRVLSWLGEDGVPVARGMAGPLVRPLRDAAVVHAESGLGRFAPPPSGAVARGETAPEFMLRTVREHAPDLTLVCTGPLTNLAVALRLEPDLPRLVRRLVIMGGAFTVPGNVTPAAEFNIHVDPEAAAVVARSELDATWIGLDVTHQVALSPEEWRGLESATEPEAKLVYDACRYSFADRGARRFPLHDPLAVAVAAQPDLVTTVDVGVRVDTGLWGTAGETRMVRDDAGPTQKVALEVDGERFFAMFRGALGLPAY